MVKKAILSLLKESLVATEAEKLSLMENNLSKETLWGISLRDITVCNK